MANCRYNTLWACFQPSIVRAGSVYASAESDSPSGRPKQMFAVDLSIPGVRACARTDHSDLLLQAARRVAAYLLLLSLGPAMTSIATCGQCSTWLQMRNLNECTTYCSVSSSADFVQQSMVLHSKHLLSSPLTEENCNLLCHSLENVTVETSLLSPLIKSFLTAREPAALKHRGRAAVMHRIEQRMRFLAVGAY